MKTSSTTGRKHSGRTSTHAQKAPRFLHIDTTIDSFTVGSKSGLELVHLLEIFDFIVQAHVIIVVGCLVLVVVLLL